MNKVAIICIIALSVLTLYSKIEVNQAGNNSVQFKWTNPEWQLLTQGDYVYISSAELAIPERAGAPMIPYDEAKVGIPLSGFVSINITNQTFKEVTLEKRILPVPLVRGGNGAEADYYQYNPDESLYNTLSEEWIIPLPAQRFRNLSFVPLRINPFVYDGMHNLKVLTSLECTITISGSTEQKNSTPLDDLAALMSKQMLNPIQTANWQASERAAINYADFSKSDHWIRIETDKDGMFKITQGQLDISNINDIDPATFRLFTSGGEVQSDITNNAGPPFMEIPIYVAGESDGSFDSNDYILFYGRDRDGIEMNQNVANGQYNNPYSKNVCYWLTYSSSFSGSPLRMNVTSPLSAWYKATSTFQETVRLETEYYQRTPEGFDWYFKKLFGNTTASYGPYSINLEDLDETQPQTLSLRVIQEYLKSGSGTNHKLKIKANNNYLQNTDNTVKTWTWTGLSALTVSHTAKSFSNGNNDIILEVIRGGADNLFFDYYQVAYQKKLIKRNSQIIIAIPDSLANKAIKYDFTGTGTNIRVFKATNYAGYYNVEELPVNSVSGGFNFVGNGINRSKYIVALPGEYYTPVLIQSVVPTDLAHTSQSYDNIIITPSVFYQHAQSLANLYNQKLHLNSKVVLMQDVFNQFNGGMPDPNAIRNYLRYCVANYAAPAITTVTLLGAGTNDWRNYSGQAATKNKCIVYQKTVTDDSYSSTITSDDYYVMLNTNQYPELAIGRYPAKSVNELNNMLSNFENYVTNPQSGLWKNNLLFMADDEFNGDSVGEYSHSVDLHNTSIMINRSVLIDRIYALEYNFDEFQNKPEARDDMFKAINDGKLVWYYIGHGSFDTLGAEDYFKGSADMGKFNNSGKLPLFIAASCDVAQYDSFSFDSAAEKVVLADDRGAIASIAATRLSSGPSNNALFQQYFKYSINFRNTVGYALVMAKNSYSDTYNSKKYNILGDPNLLISTPERDSTITFTTSSGDNLLNTGEKVDIQGQFSGINLNDTAQIMVYNSDVVKRFANNIQYTKRGEPIYRGSSGVSNSQYNASFRVPGDIRVGNAGLIIGYLWNQEQQKGYINYLPNLSFSSQADTTGNHDIPDIKLYLNSTDFEQNSVVNTNPMLIAKVSDQNGINITNFPGHNIMLIMDKSASIYNVTDYFTYDNNSSTEGTILYQLKNLREGPHTLQLIAFDNLNVPNVEELKFVVSKKNSLTIKDFMPYPNPMKKDGYFTFVLSDNADIKLSIYTIRGKKIKTIKTSSSIGYNQIYWNGRDDDGDLLANNIYFIKLTAHAATGQSKAEKTEKLVIYH